MTNSERRPIRSLEDRAGLTPEPQDEVEPGLEEEDLRKLALDRGFRLVRDPRIGKGQRVRMLLHVSVEVRQALEAARGQLGLNYSEIVDRSVVMFLESRGLRVEGWSEDRAP